MIKSMSDKDYFAYDAVDQSLLKKFMVSPKAYIAALDDDSETDAMKFGSLVHTYVLGSGAHYAPKPDMRTKNGKEEAANLIEQGKTLVAQNDMETALQMSAVTHPYFEAIPGRPEMAIIADDQWNGLTLKGKIDWLPDSYDSDGIYRIRDYKTTTNSPEAFGRTAFTFGYHIQAAYYMMLAKLEGYTNLEFEFVVQEKTAPYDYMIWRFSPEQEEIEIANQRISNALRSFSEIRSHKDWREQMANIGLPKTPQYASFLGWQLDAEAVKLGE